MGKTSKKENDKPWEGHSCNDCEKCVPYMKFETLTVKDKKPTMGICPHVTERKVLLSERACKEYFKLKHIKL